MPHLELKNNQWEQRHQVNYAIVAAALAQSGQDYPTVVDLQPANKFWTFHI